MVLYAELGRRTPPPPPFSLRKRSSTKVKVEVSQPPAPPPPPPYLTSTPKSDCPIPSIDELWRQAMSSDDSYMCRNRNAIQLPPVPRQCSVAQAFNSQQEFPENRKYSWYCPRVPAHPVEPKWAPVGIPAYSGRPLGGATAPLLEFPRERIDHSTPRSLADSEGTRIHLDHVNLASQSTGTVVMMDQKPLHALRKQSSRDIASLTNIITTTDATRSALPSQQAVKKLPTVSPLQGPDAVEKVADVKSLMDANEGSSSHVDPKDGDGKSSLAGTALRGQDLASPARSNREPRKRPSASARFVPYERRQSKVAEKLEQRLGVAVVEACTRSFEMRVDLEMNEDEQKRESSN